VQGIDENRRTPSKSKATGCQNGGENGGASVVKLIASAYPRVHFYALIMQPVIIAPFSGSG
jgi:hypothetical protein